MSDRKVDREAAQAEVDANFEAFQKLSFDDDDRGKYALMKSGKLVEIMDTENSCAKLAKRIICDGIYSVEKIPPKKEWDFSAKMIDTRTEEEKAEAKARFARAKAEVAANFEAFQKLSFSESDKGKYALMKGGKLVGITDTKDDCLDLARKVVKDDLFSIQEIDPEPIWIFSGAVLSDAAAH